MSLFGKKKLESITLSQATDWMLNMRDAFLQRAAADSEANSTSFEMMAWFTLIMSSHSCRNILKLVPSLLHEAGVVFRELRAYYDCFWQNYLLKKYNSSENRTKISLMYPMVEISTSLIAKTLFKDNKRIELMIGRAFGREYEDAMKHAVYVYINKKILSSNKYLVNKKPKDSIDALAITILAASGASGADPFQQDTIREIMEHDEEQALKMVFLTRFDLTQCQVPELPLNMYK